MIRRVADQLVSSEVRATWFVTHDSPILADLRRERLFEVGIHPNFMPESTQGRSQGEVISRLKAMMPEAKTLRTHSLFQSEPLLAELCEAHGFEIDCSVFQQGVPHL